MRKEDEARPGSIIDFTLYFDSISFLLAMLQRLITTSGELLGIEVQGTWKLAESIPVAEGWSALRDPDVWLS